MSGKLLNQSIQNCGPKMDGICPPYRPAESQIYRQTDWHNDPRIGSVRKSIIKRMRKFFREHQKSKEWGKSKILKAVIQMEAHLFEEAATLEEYRNPDTLLHRMFIRVRAESGRYQNQATKSFSVPCFSNFSVRMRSPVVSNSSCNSNSPGTISDSLLTDNRYIPDGCSQQLCDTSSDYGSSNMLLPMNGLQVSSQDPLKQHLFDPLDSLSSSIMFQSQPILSPNKAFNAGSAFTGCNLQYVDWSASAVQSYPGFSGSGSHSNSQHLGLNIQHQVKQQGQEVNMARSFAGVNNQNMNHLNSQNLSHLGLQSEVRESTSWLHQSIQTAHSSQNMLETFDVLPHLNDWELSTGKGNLLQSQVHMQNLKQFELQAPNVLFDQPSDAYLTEYHGAQALQIGSENNKRLQQEVLGQYYFCESQVMQQQPLKQDPGMSNNLPVQGHDLSQKNKLSSEDSVGVQNLCVQNRACFLSTEEAAGFDHPCSELDYPHNSLLSSQSEISTAPDYMKPLLGLINNCHSEHCHCSLCRHQLLHQHNCESNACRLCGPVARVRNSNTSGCSLKRSRNFPQSTIKNADSNSIVNKTIEDIHPKKLLRTEDSSVLFSSKNVTSEVLTSVIDQPFSSQQVEKMEKQPGVHTYVGTEAIEVQTESCKSPIQEKINIGEIRLRDPDESYSAMLNGNPVISEESVTCSTLVDIQDHIKSDQHKKEKEHATMTEVEYVRVTKLEKPRINGVALTELFNKEQIEEHISSLRQWVGQGKAKVEKNQAIAHPITENACQLCKMEKLFFQPPPIYCSLCGARIKRKMMYYTGPDGIVRYYFCTLCYNGNRVDSITVDGHKLHKVSLQKKKNDEEIDESWVQCDKCQSWQHQICALFNPKRNEEEKCEYICPYCYLKELECGERKPLGDGVLFGAKDLPKTKLSDHIEKRLFLRLKQERKARAEKNLLNFDEVPGAEDLVVRVVLSLDKRLEVRQNFRDTFQEENYPTEFLYRSRVILLFQRIEGADVCLFGMCAQEFGSDCCYPNKRCVYLSYLDSVKYFRPEIKTVTGEALRTFVYHEILIGYLDYCKKRGFLRCHIWACPPFKGDDYILYCHPEIQKMPKSDKLREWYLTLLRKAANENIVVNTTNLYDHFFVPDGECKAKITAARLPYFEGDYWPGAAEDLIYRFNQVIVEGKPQGKGKMSVSRRTLKAMRQTDMSENATKDIILMQKLGETILPMKEDFIMVHLHYSCTHCSEVIISGNRWICKQCKNFQLCERCHDMEKNLDERKRHPFKSKRKHELSPVEVNDVPSNIEDECDIVDSELFENRHSFLNFCQVNHYQHDTLRRAKHSSMMILHHLHNPTAPAVIFICSICHTDIEVGESWHCNTCPEFIVCNVCYQREGAGFHAHKMTIHSSMGNHKRDTKEAWKRQTPLIKQMLEVLDHAARCRLGRSNPCSYQDCVKIKKLFAHVKVCKIRAARGCETCKKVWYILRLHTRNCRELECPVPRCMDLKKLVARLQLQSDSRRRAAVTEFVRQQAAGVAG